MSTSTFPEALADLLRTDAARPLVTFYDDDTGERIELSVTTFANWVAKTAGLVQDELALDRGDLVLIDLPTHWLGAVWLGAAWSTGLCVTADRDLADEADLVVCGPHSVEEYAGSASARPVVAISLRPLGGRFVDPLPSGVTDYGAVVLAQPDAFTAYDPPTGDDAGWRGDAGSTSQAELLAAVAADPVVPRHGRLLTDVNPCTREGLATLVSPVLQGGSSVWVANPDASRWEKRVTEERATTQLRAAAPSAGGGG